MKTGKDLEVREDDEATTTAKWLNDMRRMKRLQLIARRDKLLKTRLLGDDEAPSLKGPRTARRKKLVNARAHKDSESNVEKATVEAGKDITAEEHHMWAEVLKNDIGQMCEKLLEDAKAQAPEQALRQDILADIKNKPKFVATMKIASLSDEDLLAQLEAVRYTRRLEILQSIQRALTSKNSRSKSATKRDMAQLSALLSKTICDRHFAKQKLTKAERKAFAESLEDPIAPQLAKVWMYLQTKATARRMAHQEEMRLQDRDASWEERRKRHEEADQVKKEKQQARREALGEAHMQRKQERKERRQRHEQEVFNLRILGGSGSSQRAMRMFQATNGLEAMGTPTVISHPAYRRLLIEEQRIQVRLDIAEKAADKDLVAILTDKLHSLRTKLEASPVVKTIGRPAPEHSYIPEQNGLRPCFHPEGRVLLVDSANIAGSVAGSLREAFMFERGKHAQRLLLRLADYARLKNCQVIAMVERQARRVEQPEGIYVVRALETGPGDDALVDAVDAIVAEGVDPDDIILVTNDRGLIQRMPKKTRWQSSEWLAFELTKLGDWPELKLTGPVFEGSRGTYESQQRPKIKSKDKPKTQRASSAPPPPSPPPSHSKQAIDWSFLTSLSAKSFTAATQPLVDMFTKSKSASVASAPASTLPSGGRTVIDVSKRPETAVTGFRFSRRAFIASQPPGRHREEKREEGKKTKLEVQKAEIERKMALH